MRDSTSDGRAVSATRVLKNATQRAGLQARGSAVFIFRFLSHPAQPHATLQKIRTLVRPSTRVILECCKSGRADRRCAVDAADAKRAADILGAAVCARFPERAAAEARCARLTWLPERAESAAICRCTTDWRTAARRRRDLETASRAATRIPRSPTIPTACRWPAGLSMERVAAQHREIDQLNAKYQGRFRLLKGIEANIRADGSVDMTPGELGQMEIVVAAPHSALRSAADQTPRMIGAVQTAGVHILGHPRGRMYGSRPGSLRNGSACSSPRPGQEWQSSSMAIRRARNLDFDLARLAMRACCLFAIG